MPIEVAGWYGTEWRAALKSWPGVLSGDPDPDPDPDPWVPGVQPSGSNMGWEGIGSPALESVAGGTYNGTDQTFINKHFTSSFVWTGNGLTMQGCKIDGTLNIRSPGGADVQDTSMRAIVLAANAKDVSIQRFKVQAVSEADADGIHITSDGGSGQKCERLLLQDGFVGGPATFGAEQHYDGMQVRGVYDLTVRGVFFDAGTTPSSKQTASIFLQNANGGNDLVLIEHNWSRVVGAYHFYLFATNLNMKDNILYRTPSAVPVYPNPDPFTESGNVWDNGDPLTLGA